eukprot:g32438.t1
MDKVLNEYFSSVFTMKTWELGEVSGDILGAVYFIVQVVLEVLECMEVDKSPGPDQIYPRTLPEAREDEVLEDWRVANVVALFKNGCKEKPGNYRPASLTSVV